MADEESEGVSTQSTFKLPPNITQEVNKIKKLRCFVFYSYKLKCIIINIF